MTGKSRLVQADWSQAVKCCLLFLAAGLFDCPPSWPGELQDNTVQAMHGHVSSRRYGWVFGPRGPAFRWRTAQRGAPSFVAFREGWVQTVRAMGFVFDVPQVSVAWPLFRPFGA